MSRPQDGPRPSVLIVYESFFGNTEQVAQAIGRALEPQANVRVLKAADAQPDAVTGVNLLIIGSPTRAFRPTPGAVGFLKRLPKRGLHGVRVAAFDTRIAKQDVKNRALCFCVKTFGYAAEPLGKRMAGLGGDAALEPEGFQVQDSEGPLKEGELDRAAEWALRALGIDR